MSAVFFCPETFCDRTVSPGIIELKFQNSRDAGGGPCPERKNMKRIIAVVLLVMMLCNVTGCSEITSDGPDGNAQEMTNSSSAAAPEGIEASDAFLSGYRAYAMDLMRSCYDGETVMISPYSAYAVLAMIMNGAEGMTKQEFEETFGASLKDVNNGFAEVAWGSAGRGVVETANSVWIDSAAKNAIEKNFLTVCGNYYRSAVFTASFADGKTVDSINDWVKKNTKNRIAKILESLDPNAVMVLVNAVTFDGKWVNPFKYENTYEKAFYHADGTEETKDMMHGTADRYFENEYMTGFEKYYENGYVFRAVLPKDGVSIEEALSKLSLENIPYANASSVHVRIPKFTEEATILMNDPLQDIGLRTMFTGDADFSGICKESLHVSSVIQKTYIKMDELGTEAAAATALTLAATAYMPEEEIRYVYLDHPFIYMIVDENYDIPLFIGTYE